MRRLRSCAPLRFFSSCTSLVAPSRRRLLLSRGAIGLLVTTAAERSPFGCECWLSSSNEVVLQTPTSSTSCNTAVHPPILCRRNLLTLSRPMLTPRTSRCYFAAPKWNMHATCTCHLSWLSISTPAIDAAICGFPRRRPRYHDRNNHHRHHHDNDNNENADNDANDDNAAAATPLVREVSVPRGSPPGGGGGGGGATSRTRSCQQDT